MIHIIGTAHAATQFWSDVIRRCQSLDACATTVTRFEAYLRGAATSLRATVIAEENSEYAVTQYEGGFSVVKKVADELGVHHIYCDPDRNERHAANIRTSAERETVWMHRIRPFYMNDGSIIFVCGADHSLTFGSLLGRNGLRAQIYCQDWTIEGAK